MTDNHRPSHPMSIERSLAWDSCKVLARVLTTVLFDLKVYGARNVPARGGALIVSNHQSYLDPVLIGVRLPRPLDYIAKSELFENRVGSWLLRTLFNAFPVRQGAGDVGAVKETIQRLREGHLLNLYPEGGRSEDGAIGPMLKGVALIARRAQVPVVPVVIVGAFDAWPVQRKLFQPGPVKVRYGPPMYLENLEPDEILATIDRTLRSMFDEMNHANGRAMPARPPSPAGP